MLTPPQRGVHLVMSKISIGRDPKNSTTYFNGQDPIPCLNGQNQTLASMIKSHVTLLENSQTLRALSSGHDVIHTPASLPVWEFIMTMVIIVSFLSESVKLHPMTMHLN